MDEETRRFVPVGRANTPEEKKAIIERLLAAWCSCPSLRLGQLLSNAVPSSTKFYYAEDAMLIESIERFINTSS